MRKQMVSITEPSYPVNQSPYPRLMKESKSIVSLPKISNITNSLNRGFSYKKIYDRANFKTNKPEKTNNCS